MSRDGEPGVGQAVKLINQYGGGDVVRQHLPFRPASAMPSDDAGSQTTMQAARLKKGNDATGLTFAATRCSQGAFSK
jgi:hypothetical protein